MKYKSKKNRKHKKIKMNGGCNSNVNINNRFAAEKIALENEKKKIFELINNIIIVLKQNSNPKELINELNNILIGSGFDVKENFPVMSHYAMIQQRLSA